MHTTSPSRRAAGLVAVAAIGLSTAVLSVPGVAAAAPVLPSLSFSTEDGDVTSGVVPVGICGIEWRVIGGEGGVDSENAPGLPGGELKLTTVVRAGDAFDLFAGAAGTDGPGEDSVISVDGDALLVAGGGQLAGGDPAVNVGFDQRVSVRPHYDSSFSVYGVGAAGSGHTGDGLIEGTGVLCTPPPAPYVEQYAYTVTEDSVTLRFHPINTVDQDGNPMHGGHGIPFQPASGYEYSLDGTAWHPLTATPGTGEDQDLYGTVGGLTKATTYSIKIRSTSLVGPGPASETITAVPVRTYPRPIDVVVKPGVRSLTVSWKPPADATGITGYHVEAYPQVASDSMIEGEAEFYECTTGTAADLDCTFPVEAGPDYLVVVYANSDEEHYSADSSADTFSGPVPDFVAPATVPAASAPLATTDADKAVKVGEQVTVSGSGYLPGSEVDIVIYSTPQVLTTVVADADGAFTATVTVPAGLANGTHHLVAAGVDEDGNPRNLVLEVTVTGGVAAVTGAVPAGTSPAAGTSAAGTSAAGTSNTGTKPTAAAGGLAYTGFTALPFVGGGLLTLLAGGGLLVAARRRRQA